MTAEQCLQIQSLLFMLSTFFSQVAPSTLNIGVIYRQGYPQYRVEEAVAQVNGSIHLYLREVSSLPEPLTDPLQTTASLSSLENWDAFNIGKSLSTLESLSPSMDLTLSMFVLETCQQCRGLIDIMSDTSSNHIIICDTQQSQVFKPCARETLEQKAMKVILDHLHLPNLVVFYDQRLGSGLTQVVDEISDDYTNLVYVDVNETLAEGALESILMDNLRLNEIRNFVISTKINKTIDLLKRTLEINLLGPEFNWLIDMTHDTSGKGVRRMKEYMNDGDNTAVVTKGNTQLSETEILYSYVKRSLQSLPEMNGTTHNHTEPIREVVLRVNKCRTSCAGANGLTTVAEVDDEGSFKHLYNGSAIFPGTFEGFNNRLFKVVTKHYPPFVVRNDSKGTREYSGLCIALLEVLAENLNFRYEISEVPDGKFGVVDDLGHWNGMIGVVRRQEFDFAAAPLTIDSKREHVVDFTFPYWEEPSTVLIRPATNDPVTIIVWIFKPLKWSTWILIVCSVFAVAGLVLAFTRASANITQVQDPMTSYPSAFWYCFGAFIQQGGYQEPSCFAGRVIAGCWWFMVIVIYAIYTGNLIAFLTVSKSSMPFNTLEAMAAQTDYYYGLEDGIIHMQIFKEAPDGSVYAKLWDGISQHANRAVVTSQAEGLEKVRLEKYGYIGEKTPMLTETATDCSLAFIKEEFFKSGFGFAMPEGWPYTKYFSKDIMHLVESGFIEHWKLKYWPVERCEQLSTTIHAKAITLEELSGSYYILLIGMFVSLCFLIGERVVKRMKSKSEELPVAHAHNSVSHPVQEVTSETNFSESSEPYADRNHVENPVFVDSSDSDENKPTNIPRLNNDVSITKDNLKGSFRKRSKPVISRNDWAGSVERKRASLKQMNGVDIHIKSRHIHHGVTALQKEIPVNGINENCS